MLKKIIISFYLVLQGLIFVFYALAIRRKKKNIFFFPYYHTGGAENVHSQIVLNCTVRDKNIVLFTKSSKNNHYLEVFKTNAKCFNLGRFMRYSFSKKLITFILEKLYLKNALLFGSNSQYFYEFILTLTDKDNQKVNTYDLTHSFNESIETERILVQKFIDKRIVITETLFLQLAEFYRTNLPMSCDDYIRKIHVIKNFVDVKNDYPQKPLNKRLRVIYVGRDSEEKRLYLIEKIAERCKRFADFVFVGDVRSIFNSSKNTNLFFKGLIYCPEKIREEFIYCDVVLITSDSEGFPLSVMEGMSNGVIPVVTNVGDLSNQIRNGLNGYVIFEEKEESIVEEFSATLNDLFRDAVKRKEVSQQAYLYAKTNFSKVNFIKDYNNLLSD